jgi:hypothetical protein
LVFQITSWLQIFLNKNCSYILLFSNVCYKSCSSSITKSPQLHHVYRTIMKLLTLQFSPTSHHWLLYLCLIYTPQHPIFKCPQYMLFTWSRNQVL